MEKEEVLTHEPTPNSVELKPGMETVSCLGLHNVER